MGNLVLWNYLFTRATNHERTKTGPLLTLRVSEEVISIRSRNPYNSKTIGLLNKRNIRELWLYDNG